MLGGSISLSSPPPSSLTTKEMRLFLWQLAYQTGLCSFDSAPWLRQRQGITLQTNTSQGNAGSRHILPPHREQLINCTALLRRELHTAVEASWIAPVPHPH